MNKEDCTNCKHNIYLPETTDWVDCGHPLTIAKTIAVTKEDPAIVNYRTSDIPVSRINEIGECKRWELYQPPRQTTGE